MLLLAHNLDVDAGADSGEEEEPPDDGDEAGAGQGPNGRAAASRHNARGPSSSEARASTGAAGRAGITAAGFDVLAEEDAGLLESPTRRQQYHYAGEDEGEEEQGKTRAYTKS
jgi:hypothetical protein